MHLWIKNFLRRSREPWPIHDCQTSWTRNLIRRKRSDGGIEVDLSEGITVSRAPSNFRVAKSVIEDAQLSSRAHEPDPIKTINPALDSKPFPIIGILREKFSEVDVFSKLKIELNSLGAQFIGDLAKGTWGRVTIHEPSFENDVRHSYTIWVKSKALLNPKNSRGVTIMAEIKPLHILGYDSVWVATSYEVMG